MPFNKIMVKINENWLFKTILTVRSYGMTHIDNFDSLRTQNDEIGSLDPKMILVQAKSKFVRDIYTLYPPTMVILTLCTLIYYF